MESNNTTSQEIPSLSGTIWTITDQNNNQATLQFNNDNTGLYTMDGSPVKHFYWWQYGAFFWTQEKKTEQGWFTLIEGSVNGSESGIGKTISAQQANGEVYVSAFTMTLTS